ncbi:MAG: hypothetical protein PQJ61_10670 [Spirochaetales bacterium]|uniref:Uncharacterized protein n=1 Tax=Candidatus Thalassospirochaeta sargassi TaxID=3119039 RepID=A0AAJ1IG20_9SPIO|nr:hypothetical protein [Spirochaetales bacterium]
MTEKEMMKEKLEHSSLLPFIGSSPFRGNPDKYRKFESKKEGIAEYPAVGFTLYG